MSRRSFLQNMRQEVRRWETSDPDSPHTSEDNTANRAPPPNVDGAGTRTSAAGTRDAPLPDSTLLNTHLTEFTVVSATTVADSPSSSPPPEMPLTVVEVDAVEVVAATAPPPGANGFVQPTLSPETLGVEAVDAAPGESPFSAESPPSWAPPHVSTAVPDVLTTPRAFSRRRSSNPRGSIGASNRSPSTTAPVAVRRSSRRGSAAPTASKGPTAYGQSRDRSGSTNRMEASLIALQVELATEKRTNIEAEHHIMTLNAEVEKLRRNNAQLSRELAEAATVAATAHRHSNAHAHKAAAAAAAANASASASTMEVESATRVEALEARLGELSRNLESKQRELATKDERIRLLEHKLADQLLMQTGVHYMAVPAPVAAPASPLMGGPHHHTMPSHFQNNGNASLSGQSVGSATAAGVPPRRPRSADIPDSSSAGPRIGAVRHVTVAGVTHSSDDPRTTSALRRRSPVGHAGGPSDDLRRLSPVPQKTEAHANGAASAQPPATRATAAAAAAARETPEDAVRAAPRRPSVRRPPPVRPESTRGHSARRKQSHTSSDDGSVVRAAMTAAGPRGVSKPMESGRRRVGSLAGEAPSKQRELEEAPSARHGARRPSVNRRTSAVTARGEAAEGSQRRGSRRDSTAAPPAWQQSAAHFSHVNVSGNAAPSSGSTTGSIYAMNQRALSTYRSARQPSTTRSVAQQSVRSSTSMRPRPQIAFTSDGDTSTMKGTTATVMFRARDTRKESNFLGEGGAASGAAASAVAADSVFADEPSAAI